MPSEPVETPSLGLALCVERGPLEAQAVLLCESLRHFGGRFRDAPIYAFAPRPERRPGAATVAALEALDVEYLDQALDTGCPEYGSANRVAAAAHAEGISSCEWLAVLDTDTLFLAEPTAFALPSSLAAAVRPIDVKGIGTSGTGDPNDRYWQELCACCGVDYDGLPWVTPAEGGGEVKACYNGGLVVVRRDQGILTRWRDYFLTSVRRDLRPPASPIGGIRSSTGMVPEAAARWWGSNQAALALALWSEPRRVEVLPPVYNYPLHMHRILPPGTRVGSLRDLVHVHYHYTFDADAVASNQLLHPGSSLGSEQLDWVRRRVPFARPSLTEHAAAVESTPQPQGARRGSVPPLRPLIITGMHRSATSLVASVLQRAGLEVGRDQTGDTRGNPRGHFEDRDFHRLHEDLLAAAGRTSFTADRDLSPAADSPMAWRAQELVAARSKLPAWGWKDPRTALFLELWHGLLPEAGYLFLYRHPLDVALSLWRRDSDDELRRDPLLAFRSWQVYNERILAFAIRHRERCLLVHVPTVTEDLEGLVASVAERFSLPLRPGGLDQLYDAMSLAPPLHALDSLCTRLLPDVMALYRCLEQRADVPSRQRKVDLEPSESARLSHRAWSAQGLLLEALLIPLIEQQRQSSSVTELEAGVNHLRGQLVELHARHLELHGRHADLQKRHHGRIEAASAAAASANADAESLHELRRRLAEQTRAAVEATAEAARARQGYERLESTMRQIEGARSFALVRRWWSLRQGLKRRVRRQR